MAKAFQLERHWKTNAGLDGMVIANDLGFRCGYAEIPWWHPWHGASYDDAVTAPDPSYIEMLTLGEAHEDFGPLPTFLALFSEGGMEKLASTVAGQVRIHGGVTFMGSLSHYQGGWWVGFDCGHAGDGTDLTLVRPELREIYDRLGTIRDGLPWTTDMVAEEVERLAVQVCGLVPNFHADRQPFYARGDLGMREVERERRRQRKAALLI